MGTNKQTRKSKGHKSLRDQKKKPKLFSLEELYARSYQNLVADLSTISPELSAFGTQRIIHPRSECPIGYSGIGNADAFKRWYQLDTFYKRVITSQDVPFEALSLLAEDEFVSFQSRTTLVNPNQTELIREVRKIVSDVLGEFVFDEFASECEFGKKAAHNVKYRNSYLDNRVKNLNGTSDQLNWFNAVRCRDIHLLRATRREIKSYSPCYVVDIISVPKSYKAARTIGIDSTVGGFLSKGLGNYIRRRLEAGTHIDLSIQQSRHKVWAQQGSYDGQLATIDMSKASDSFTIQHMDLFIPPGWREAVEVVRLPLIQTEHVKPTYYSSAMLMGSGHTFPLQTLLFYAIALACCKLSGKRGLVSVYGDDIIIPNYSAPYVIHGLQELGFQVNAHKSFWDKYHFRVQRFRESCGGDYYMGTDVRPYQPECITGNVKKHEYVAECHKIYNGLIRCWHPVEIEKTLRFLIEELKRFCVPSFVPDGQPETSGLFLSSYHWLQPSGCDLPHVKDGILQYRSLQSKTQKRIGDGRVHYWAYMRNKELGFPKIFRDRNSAQAREWAGQKFRREAVRGMKIRYKWSEA